MENNHVNNPDFVNTVQGQDKGTNFQDKSKINPDFGDLENPETFKSHFEEQKKKSEAEHKAKQNPFPVEVFPKPVQEIITATNESLKYPIDFIGA